MNCSLQFVILMQCRIWIRCLCFLSVLDHGQVRYMQLLGITQNKKQKTKNKNLRFFTRWYNFEQVKPITALPRWENMREWTKRVKNLQVLKHFRKTVAHVKTKYWKFAETQHHHLIFLIKIFLKLSTLQIQIFWSIQICTTCAFLIVSIHKCPVLLSQQQFLNWTKRHYK